MPTDRSDDRKRVSPAKFAHFVVRTHPDRIDTLVEWYCNLLQADIVFRNPFAAFMTYDDEHHRVAVVAMPGLVDRPAQSTGIDHLAFTYASLGDLIHTYERLLTDGVTPAMPIHHGPTLSLYYLDPDGNQVELQIDVFATSDEVDAYLTSGAFERNPIGVSFDPAELARRFHAGEPEAELIRPLDGPPPSFDDFPVH